MRREIARRAAAALCALALSAGLAAPPALAEDASSGAAQDNVYKQRAAEEEAAEQEEQADRASSADELRALVSEKPDGVYYGSAEGYQSTITVAVTVKDGRLTDVKVVSHADDAAYLKHAEEGVVEEMLEEQSPQVDTVAGATFSSRGIIDAARDALEGTGQGTSAGGSWVAAAALVAAALLFAAAAALTARRLRATTASGRRAAEGLQRLAVQAMFLVLAPSAFASAFMGLKNVFMQLAAAQGHRGAYDFQLSAFTALLLGLLAFTAVFGRFFCGYACSFGLLGDVLFKASKAATDRLGVRRRLPRGAERALRGAKYVVLLAVCGVVWLGFSSFVNDGSPWTAFSSLLALSLRRVTVVGGVLLALVVAGMLWRERFFCEFLCPLGALFSLVPTLPSGRMRRSRPDCLKGCSACRSSCPVGAEPSGGVLAGECLMCGRCAQACPADNVTEGMQPRPGDREGRPGPLDVALSHCVAVLWKALVLIAVLWALGATRYLPTF